MGASEVPIPELTGKPEASDDGRQLGTKLVDALDVSKVFGAVEALSHVSLTVEPGEFVSVIGPSGCGKSTFLEIVGGLQRPDGGTVEVAGGPLTGPRDATAVIFQEASTLPWRDVRDNVAFALEARGVTKKERYQRAGELIELVGLKGFERYYPVQLSGGMRQRVAIARALTTRPDLILADEPFGALDEQTRLILAFELLRIVSQAESGVLFVTHSIQEAVLLSDRVLVMSARPGSLIDDVVVTLPKPRAPELIGSKEVAALIERIWSGLRDEATKAMATEGPG